MSPSDLGTVLLLQMTAALAADPPTELTIIEVVDESGTVTLSGQVSDERLRTMAEDIAIGHPDVTQAINEVKVVLPLDSRAS